MDRAFDKPDRAWPIFFVGFLIVIAMLWSAVHWDDTKATEGYGGGIPAFTAHADTTPPSMGLIMCGVDGSGLISNWYFGPSGLHGARLIVTGQCDTNHGPHPRNPPKDDGNGK